MKKDLHLAPAPRRMTMSDGTFTVDPNGYILLDDCSLWKPLRIAADADAYIAPLHFTVKTCVEKPQITVQKADLPHEAYTLTVSADGIAVTYGDVAGAFYAFATLKQVTDVCGAAIPFMEIADEPAFPVRGYMMDVGRNRVPRREELFRVADRIAGLKYNHLELYMEGVPFEYASYPEMWKGRELLTGEDILALDEYCKERFIDLVPTQNNFGHMDKWVQTAFADLAESPQGFVMGGSHEPPRCLDPLDPRSEELVRGINRDLLPYFSSDKYNICCDETIELGMGKAKEACEQKGKGRVYLEFLKKVCDVAHSYGKTPLFWDDILKDYPELFDELPKDTIALEWGYGPDQPSEDACKMLMERGVHYYVCPGTSCWNTLTGVTDNMIPNIRRAAMLGQKYGAEGMITTDWGDWGHLQGPATGYAGILWGAAQSWSPEESNGMDIAAALDRHIFFDNAGVMGQLAMDAGRYIAVEPKVLCNITLSFRMLTLGLESSQITDDVDDAAFDRLTAFFDDKLARLQTVDLHCPQADLIKEEYATSLELLRMAQDIGRYTKALQRGDAEAQIRHLLAIEDVIGRKIDSIHRTWNARDKESYIDWSLAILDNIKTDTKRRLGELGVTKRRKFQ